MPKFRKKPVVIEAVQFKSDGPDNHFDILQLAGEHKIAFRSGTTPSVVIKTLEGDMRADKGDWIIRGVQGEIYPCKSDIFEATYEAV